MSEDVSSIEEAPKANSEESTEEDISVDGGYGWVNVASMLLVTAHTWGINGAFGVYLAYYIDASRFPEGTPLQYAFISGISISQITFVAPIVTKSNQKLGLKPTLLIGAVLEAAALISSSFAQRVWQLYLSQGILFGWGCGFLYIGGSGVVPQWFTRRRAFANSIASSGSGLGGLIWCLATGAMIKNLGLSWAFRVTAIIAFTVNIVCALLIKDRNRTIRPSGRAFDTTLFRNHEFLLLLVWGFFSMLGYTILLFSLPSFARGMGLSSDQASILGAMVNLGMAVGRPIVGFYSYSIGGINMAMGATFFGSLVCCFVWMFADSYGVLIFAAVLGGSVCGTFWATIPPLTSDAIGIRQLRAGLSTIWTSVVIPCLFAEPIALSLQGNSNKSSKAVQIFSGSMFLGGALSLLLLRNLKVTRLTSSAAGDSPKATENSSCERAHPKEVTTWLHRTFAWGKF